MQTHEAHFINDPRESVERLFPIINFITVFVKVESSAASINRSTISYHLFNINLCERSMAVNCNFTIQLVHDIGILAFDLFAMRVLM